MDDFFDSNNFPRELRDRATLRGNEFAWQLEDIPRVIEAIKVAGYINIGGQLQFRLRGGGTCECYEVEVDTCNILEKLDRSEHIAVSADEALRQFNGLPSKFNFMKQGKAGFGKVFSESGATQSDIEEAMCFVWYAGNADKVSSSFQ